jgi:hypothetical protein
MGTYEEIPEDFENLEKHAPLLSGIKKENPFTLPDDYFGDLSSEIESLVLSSSFPKEQAFEVPQDYFDNLPFIIQNKIVTRTNKARILNLNWSSKIQIFAVAASLFIVCLTGLNYWSKYKQLHAVKPLTGENRHMDKTIEYLAEHTDQSVLEDVLAEEQNSKRSEKEDAEAISDEYIINYLVDHHVELDENELNDTE